MTVEEHIRELDEWWKFLEYVHYGMVPAIALSHGMDQMVEMANAFKDEHPEAYEKWVKERNEEEEGE